MRGDVYRVNLTDVRGHEQRGRRCVVIVQSDDLHVSTWLAVPTTTSEGPQEKLFRPTLQLMGRETRALCEFVRPINPERLGDFVGRVSADELRRIDEGLRLVLDL